MKKTKKKAAMILSLMLSLCICSQKSYAEESASALGIENTFNVSDCTQGDTVLLSVNLKDSPDAPQEISSMEGILEYDTSLFTVEKTDILPAESESVQAKSFDAATGTFQVQYAKDISVPDGSLLLQIRLHVAADASLGKTTVCVTQMKWNNSAGAQAVEIEHRVPARIAIAQAEKTADTAGDVNQDGTVNLTDAKLIMQYYNGARTLNSQQQKNADVNGDGKVNLTDAKLIMKYYNREITQF